MKNHEQQSGCMSKQDEHMQLILQHIQMNNSISDPSDYTTSKRHKGDHIIYDSAKEY